MKSWTQPTDRMINRALASLAKEADRQHFFSQLKNPLWIQPLVERGRFQSPPKLTILPGGNIQMPVWPELRYLKNVADEVPAEVADVVLAIPKVENPRVYSDILAIALQLHGELSGKLVSKILEYVDLEHHLNMYHLPDLLVHWTVENCTDAALKLTKALVGFSPDPQDKTKRIRRGEEPTDLTAIAANITNSLLEPVPSVDRRNYRRILTKGVRPLAEKNPYNIACILIEATANMISLRTHQEDLLGGIDHSGSWCERLTESEGDFETAENSLVHTLTYACDQVHQKRPDAVTKLNNILRDQRPPLFKRLRCHLYAQHPNDTTKPWIQILIREHKAYDWAEHEYEFQQMIQKACKCFGESLLSKEEREQIFAAIRCGPSKTTHQNWLRFLGEEFTEEGFRKRRRHFHRMQFRPFAPLLFGDYADYFHELEREVDDRISDDDYPPRRTKSGHVSTRSPYSPGDLANLTDEELLSYVNEWDEKEDFFDGNNLIEISVLGLSKAFQTVFKEYIVPDPNRHRFWMENRDRIERPIYVERIIYALRECVESDYFVYLNQWLIFGKWVLSHPDDGLNGIYDRHAGESRDNLIWSNSRWAMGDFILSCFRKDVNPPESARTEFLELLDMFCTQFDWRLDQYLTENQPADANMNAPRCRALEALVNYGLWLRRNAFTIDVPEIVAILEKRFMPDAEYPLALPEYAILGKNYRRLFYLNEAWATARKSDLFPHTEFPKWLAAFDNFLGFNPLSKRTFKIFRDDFVFALKHLSDIKKQDRPDDRLIEMLGQCLFIFYLEGLYPLKREKSLLEGFYQASGDDREQWSSLFGYVGHRLWNATKQLDINEKKKIICFFEWRIEVREPMELQQFTYWLKAECLDPDWRLSKYSKILEITNPADTSVAMEVEALCDLVPDHTEKVVECFAKLTKEIGDNNISIFAEEATAILQAGFRSSEETVQENARRAHENLLREGRFDLMELEDLQS